MSSFNIEHNQNGNHAMSLASAAAMTTSNSGGASAAAAAVDNGSNGAVHNSTLWTYWPQPQQQQQMIGMQCGPNSSGTDDDTIMASHIAKSIVEQIIQEESNPLMSFLHESKQDEQFVNNQSKEGLGDTGNRRFDQDRRNEFLARPSLSPSLEVDASTSQATSSSINTNKRSRWGPKVIVANQVQTHQKDEVKKDVSFDANSTSQSVTTTLNQNNPLLEVAVTTSSSPLVQQQHNPLHHSPQVLQLRPLTTTTSNDSTGRGPPPSITPEKARMKREQYIQMVDRPRKHAALIRNFEYIHDKEEQTLKQQLNQLSQQQETRSKQSTTKQLISNKSQALLTSKAGLGTKQRNLAVKTFDRVSGLDQNRQSTLIKEQTTATTCNDDGNNKKAGFYITGLTPFTKEESIRQLFQSFGSIERVTLYKNKSTGRLKGDALVVLSQPNDTSSGATTQPLDVDGICQQLNGCVLPSCGSCLNVQPADMEWKIKKAKQQVQKQMFHGTHDKVERLLYGGSGNGGGTLTTTSVDDTTNNNHDNPRTDNGSNTWNSTTTMEQQQTILKDDDGGGGGEQGDEDLDDFFASLKD